MGPGEEGGVEGDFQVSGLATLQTSAAGAKEGSVGEDSLRVSGSWGESESLELSPPAPVPPAFSSQHCLKFVPSAPLRTGSQGCCSPRWGEKVETGRVTALAGEASHLSNRELGL